MKILINSLRVRACHGVMAQERAVGQEFEISAELEVAYDGSDDLAATVNYAEVCDLLVAEMQQPSDLLEHAALRLCAALRGRFPAIRGGQLTMLKLA
ncbi:MAG: dihydroneopterin aldolase, partial [Muribaculaceae bacterium]|nr:dihydroneopterin aldolase [Muribaculaceae bacterium]